MQLNLFRTNKLETSDVDPDMLYHVSWPLCLACVDKNHFKI
jgi:hypothetical protein